MCVSAFLSSPDTSMNCCRQSYAREMKADQATHVCMEPAYCLPMRTKSSDIREVAEFLSSLASELPLSTACLPVLETH